MKDNLLVILGVQGALGSAISCHEDLNVDILGIDLPQATCQENLSYYLACDFSNRSQIRATIDTLPIFNYKKVIFVSCIGKFGDETFNSFSFEEESLYENIQVNLVGIAHFMIAAIKRCLTQNIPTRVIIVGSAAAYVGSRDIAYGIAKAGLNGLVLSLSKSLSSQNSVVIGVNPGIFESTMSQGVSSERQSQAIESTHIKRKGRLKEIANFVTYVAFDAPDYLTGSILNINGGQYT